MTIAIAGGLGVREGVWIKEKLQRKVMRASIFAIKHMIPCVVVIERQALKA